MVSRAHPWKLVGPWWKWARAAHPADGRVAPPALLKFAGDEFVNDFVADPQHSLVFDSQVDVVSGLDAAGAAEGWLGRMAARVNAWRPPPLTLPWADAWLAPTPLVLPTVAAAEVVASADAPSFLRKLFLPAHDRHYLLVCELHCDIPGFPSVDRGLVCEAGFVVRRRTVELGDLDAEAKVRVDVLADAEAALAVLEELDQKAPPANPDVSGDDHRFRAEQAARDAQQRALFSANGYESWDGYLAAQRAAIDTQRRELGQWFADNGLKGAIQGWTGDAWADLDPLQQVSDTTHRSVRAKLPDEQFFPLVPLIQDPRGGNQDARGRTLYYGVVPTVMADHDRQGNARFDAKSTYEIRCFVRRHDAARPRTVGAPPPDCCGDVTWSDATEPFRIAPPFDLIGTAQRPITIQMPDLKELAAQMKKRPRGKLSPVKFVQPQHLCPSGTSFPPKGSMDGPAICFFSIPLITIVALFVLNLFLPIVVLVFNLWFLLALQFCIKPQVSASLGIDAALKAKPPGVDLSVDGALNVDGADQTAAQLRSLLEAGANAAITSQVIGASPDATLQQMGVEDLAGMEQAFADNAALPQDPENAPANLGYREQLVYEPRREPQWSIAVERRA